MSADQNISNQNASGHDDDAPAPGLRRTPIYELHLAAGAKMVPFAG